MPEGYTTIERAGEAELIIKKSRFIGRCFPVDSEAAAAARIGLIKKSCWDATHNCYAYRIGAGGALSRSSDDGEPSGTAGAPILCVLSRRELTNVLCVVTRYFGGILLGAGGLIRAYADACSAAAKESGIVLMRSCTAYEMTVPYALLSTVENAAAVFGGLSDKEYTDSVRAICWVRNEEADSFLSRICSATDARVRPTAIICELRPFRAELE